MWSADYPHTDTTFPNSRNYLDDHFAGVPPEDRYKIVAGNAVKLYKLA
jgi:predicted TIM-barrel fold metal-dependent hydrolase